MLAEHDGERAGAVLLTAGPTSPLDHEPAVHVLALTGRARRSGGAASAAS